MRLLSNPGFRPKRLGAMAAFLLLSLMAGGSVARAGGVVVLRSSDLPVYQSTVAAFRRSFAPAVVDLSLDRLGPEEAVDSIRASQPEITIAIGLRAAILLHEKLPRTNLVYAMVPSPARYDLVGSRVTGIAADIPPELELGMLREIAPDVKRIGVLIGRDPNGWARRARDAGKRAGIEVRVFSVDGHEPIGPRVRTLMQESDAMWMPADAEIATPEAFRFMVGEALTHRKPLLAFAPGLVRGGAFAAAAPDLDWVGARIAEAVRRIQAGERPGDVPALEIRRVRPVINVATAKAIGRDLPGPAVTDAELVR